MNPEILEALRQLARGEGVKRGSHTLVWDGIDATAQFETVLGESGFQKRTLDEVNVRPGTRIPAFFLDGQVAHFGWIFWEMFFPGRMRKIFGSVLKNAKGDWAVILGKGSDATLFVNLTLAEEMDLERPSEF